MNMKRGLVFTLCSLAMVAAASSAMAQAPTVQLSLNLRYTDPADPSEGGKWFLVAKTNDTDGIAAISAYISNITPGAATMSYGNGSGAGASAYTTTTAANIGAILNGGNPFAATIGGAVNVVYGQDIATGPIVADVGQNPGPGNTPNDPLKNAAWNNSAIIANGTFGATRPAFVTAGANSTDANTLAGTTTGVAATDAAVTTTVRGDSLASLGLNPTPTTGLKAGDANRDFVVNSDDLGLLLFNFNQTGKSWDQGDFNDSANGAVNSDDLGLLLFNFNTTSPAAAVAAIPEPGTISLAGLAIAAMSFVTRRKR
jgi:hypothetical protein